MRDRYPLPCGSFASHLVTRMGRPHGWLHVGLALVVLAGLLSGCAGWWGKEKPRGLLPAADENALGLELLWPLPLDTDKPVKDLYLLPRTLCVVSKGNEFVAVDPEKGYPRWQHIFDDELRTRATEDDERLYLIVANRLLTIKKGMGEGGILQERSLGFVGSSAPVVDGTNAYIGSGDGRLYALNLQMRLGWQQTVRSTIRSQPQVDTTGVYFGAENGWVYAVNLTDGVRKWTFPTEGPIKADLVLVHNVLYVGSTDSRLYALDTALGVSRKQQQKWPVPYFTSGEIKQAPVVRGDTIFVVAEGTGVHAVRASDGAGLWQYPQADAFIAASGDRVFLGAEGRRLICVDRKTGDLLWEQKLPGRRKYLFVANGVNDLIYICRQKDGALFCYKPQ